LTDVVATAVSKALDHRVQTLAGGVFDDYPTPRAERLASGASEHLLWVPEETAVFAIELGSTSVSYPKGSSSGVHAIHQHACSRYAQPKLLPIPKRTHGGQRPKVRMHRRYAHASHLREISTFSGSAKLSPMRRSLWPSNGSGL